MTFFFEVRLEYQEKKTSREKKEKVTISTQMVPCKTVSTDETIHTYGGTFQEFDSKENYYCINRSSIENQKALLYNLSKEFNLYEPLEENPSSATIRVWPCDPDFSTDCPKDIGDYFRSLAISNYSFTVVNLPFKNSFSERNHQAINEKESLEPIGIEYIPSICNISVYSSIPQRVEVIDDYGLPFKVSKTHSYLTSTGSYHNSHVAYQASEPI